MRVVACYVSWLLVGLNCGVLCEWDMVSYVENEADVYIVARLFSSSLLALVSFRAPRKLKVCHFKKNTEICNYSYSNNILAVKLNRQVCTINMFMMCRACGKDGWCLCTVVMCALLQRLVVCLEESIYVHNIRDMKVIHTIRSTPKNPRGLCDLSISNECSYLAFPNSSTSGIVQIFDTISLVSSISISLFHTLITIINTFMLQLQSLKFEVGRHPKNNGKIVIWIYKSKS